VRVAFDPLTNPATATIAHRDKHEVLCEAVCVDPFAEGDASSAIATARALRQLMRREYRVLLPDRETGAQRVQVSETELRTIDRAIEIRRGGNASHEDTKDTNLSEHPTRANGEAGTASLGTTAQTATERPRGGVSEATPAPRASRADLSQSLRRRAAAVVQHENF